MITQDFLIFVSILLLFVGLIAGIFMAVLNDEWIAIPIFTMALPLAFWVVAGVIWLATMTCKALGHCAVLS